MVSVFVRLDVDVNVADGRYVLTCRVQGILTFWRFWGQGWVQENVVLYAVLMFGLRGVVFLQLKKFFLTSILLQVVSRIVFF